MASSKRDKDGLFRRGGIYYCWIRGKRLSTKCRSRKAALAVRDQLERAVADPAYRASITSTVGEFAVVTLDEAQRRGRSESTLEYYRSKLGQLVRGFGEDTRLDELTDASVVDSYIDTRRTEGAGQHTISKELGTLRHMLRIAKRRGAFPGDIDALFPVGFASGYEPRRRSLSLDEIEVLLRELTPHRQAWVAFAIVTGARDSEIARARVEDVSPSRDIVQVRGTKTELADDAVAVPVAFRWLLDLALEHGEPEGELVGSWDNAVRDLAAACKRAGIDRAGPNDLRRTHGTLLRAAGASIDVVARQLRHVDSRMAERVYARLTAGQVAGLLPGATTAPLAQVVDRTVQIQHSGDIVETEGSESVGVDDQNRTGDNWSHKPGVRSTDSGIADENEVAKGAGDVGDDHAPHGNSTVRCWGCECEVPLRNGRHEEETGIPGTVYSYPCLSLDSNPGDSAKLTPKYGFQRPRMDAGSAGEVAERLVAGAEPSAGQETLGRCRRPAGKALESAAPVKPDQHRQPYTHPPSVWALASFAREMGVIRG